jgi:hypothetical protein
MTASSAAQTELPPRGVYEAPFRVGGFDALLAVDSKGDVRKVSKLLPGAIYSRVWAALEAELDRIDPVPQLRLVSNASPVRAPRVLHPAHANDFHAYRRRLIKQLSHRAQLFRD